MYFWGALPLKKAESFDVGIRLQKMAFPWEAELLRADLKCEREIIVLSDIWFVWAPIRAFSIVAPFMQSLCCVDPDV